MIAAVVIVVFVFVSRRRPGGRRLSRRLDGRRWRRWRLRLLLGGRRWSRLRPRGLGLRLRLRLRRRRLPLFRARWGGRRWSLRRSGFFHGARLRSRNERRSASREPNPDDRARSSRGPAGPRRRTPPPHRLRRPRRGLGRLRVEWHAHLAHDRRQRRREGRADDRLARPDPEPSRASDRQRGSDDIRCQRDRQADAVRHLLVIGRASLMARNDLRGVRPKSASRSAHSVLSYVPRLPATTT
jgi:hypothetical protein